MLGMPRRIGQPLPDVRPRRRARAVREAMDLEIAPSNVNNVRWKLKRLVERGILSEAEPGLFTQPRP